jgi:uncharacterized protein (DUF433 family)
MAEDLIVSEPQILGRKPCVGGTRLSVELLLDRARRKRRDAGADSRPVSSAHA